jgi:hypothetical protein
MIEVADGFVRTGISEYDDNPLVSCLPGPLSMAETYAMLRRMPECSEHERRLPAHLRQQLVVLRLRKTFIPTTQQVLFAQQLGMLVRAGYDGAEIGDVRGIRRMAEFANQVETGARIETVVSRFAPTAYCGSLIGPSGMGKTTTATAALNSLPQVVRHVSPLTFEQLVYLRIECPTSGSPKQACIAFFDAVDRCLGTKYSKRYSGVATDQLMLGVASVAQLHRLGLLVVDEIQFLRDARVGEAEVLNFLTTLVNVINVPVMLVGTTAAVELLTTTFRNARRSEGAGSAIFDRMKNDREWKRFVTELLRLQWTSEVTPSSDELVDALWEASQGIVDIVMKIFMIAQIRLMRASETRKTREIITPGLVAKVLKEDLQLVRGMLRALKNPKSKQFARLDDLRTLDQAFENILGAHYAAGAVLPETEAKAASVPQKPKDELDETLARTLTSLGFAADVACMMVSHARAAVPSGDPLETLSALMSVAGGQGHRQTECV